MKLFYKLLMILVLATIILGCNKTDKCDFTMPPENITYTNVDSSLFLYFPEKAGTYWIYNETNKDLGIDTVTIDSSEIRMYTRYDTDCPRFLTGYSEGYIIYCNSTYYSSKKDMPVYLFNDTIIRQGHYDGITGFSSQFLLTSSLSYSLSHEDENIYIKTEKMDTITVNGMVYEQIVKVSRSVDPDFTLYTEESYIDKSIEYYFARNVGLIMRINNTDDEVWELLEYHNE